MKIGIICAVEREIKPYLENYHFDHEEKRAMLTIHKGKNHGHDIVALYSGVCKVNGAIATQVLIQDYDVDTIIISGTAGSMDQKVKILDTIISSEVAYHDVHKGILTEYHPWMETVFFQPDKSLLRLSAKLIEDKVFDHHVHLGRIVTGEQFIDQDGRQEIVENYQPLCVDMETAGMAHVCHVFEKPFLAVRSISDSEEESGEDSFDKNCDRAAYHSYLIVSELIKNMS